MESEGSKPESDDKPDVADAPESAGEPDAPEKPEAPRKPRKTAGDYGRALTRRTPAQMFALVAGVLLTLVGVIGLIVNANFGSGDELVAEKLLFFDVNGWSSLLHLLTGVALLATAARPRAARRSSAIVGGIYLVLTVWSLFDNSILGVIPINDAVAIFYAALAVIGITVGVGPEPKTNE